MGIGNGIMGNSILNIPVAAGTEIEEARMVAINTGGYAEPASAKAGITAAGYALKYCDNRQGGDGDEHILVKRGTFVCGNDGTIHETDILKKCYIKDDRTVTITETGSSVAGIILWVEEDGVAVDMMGNESAGTGADGKEQEE